MGWQATYHDKLGTTQGDESITLSQFQIQLIRGRGSYDRLCSAGSRRSGLLPSQFRLMLRGALVVSILAASLAPLHRLFRLRDSPLISKPSITNTKKDDADDVNHDPGGPEHLLPITLGRLHQRTRLQLGDFSARCRLVEVRNIVEITNSININEEIGPKACHGIEHHEAQEKHGNTCDSFDGDDCEKRGEPIEQSDEGEPDEADEVEDEECKKCFCVDFLLEAFRIEDGVCLNSRDVKFGLRDRWFSAPYPPVVIAAASAQ